MFKFLLKLAIAAMVAMIIGTLVVGGGAWYLLDKKFKEVQADPNFPDFKSFEKSPKQVTTVIDCDGEVICEIGKERRTSVPYDKIPKPVRNAFIAIEDKRFWEHDGADYEGLIGAVINAQLMGKRARGASTLDMQTIKNRFFPNRKQETKAQQEYRKWIEIVGSEELEKRLLKELGSKQKVKERIVELYLNQISFGHDWFGIEEASRKIFGKSVSDVNVLESAALAAMPKNPPYYDPSNAPGRDKKTGKTLPHNPNWDRRIIDLKAMKDQGLISEDEIKAVFAEYGPRLGKEIPATGNFEQDFKTLLTLEPITVKGTNRLSGTAQNVCDMAKDNLRKK